MAYGSGDGEGSPHGRDADASEYLRRRAELQLDLAQRAVEPRAVRAHYAIASTYLDEAAARDAESDPS